VSYSYYEVYTNAQRAFSALGFPYGADEDAAYIISWLESFDLDGIHLLSTLYPKLDDNFRGSFAKNNLVDRFDLQNRSCLMVGPGLVDFMTFHTNLKNEIKIELTNCPDPLFLIPLLYRIIKKNIFSKITKEEKLLSIVGKKNSFIHNDIKENKCSDFFIYLSKNEFEIPDEQNSINYKVLNENLFNGLNPDQAGWDLVSNLAFRSYVPDSKTSREKGAGGGDDND